METTVFYFIALTVFASLVARRAGRLNRRAWAWGLSAWLFSPLLIWIILEVAGRKKEELSGEVLESVPAEEALEA